MSNSESVLRLLPGVCVRERYARRDHGDIWGKEAAKSRTRRTREWVEMEDEEGQKVEEERRRSRLTYTAG